MRTVSKVKDNAILDTLGKRVEYLRTNKGMSQAELAEKIFVQRELLNKIENGVRSPKIEVLKDIATQLNTTTDYLLCRLDTPSIEIDNIAINEKLGLSVKAIENLEKIEHTSKYIYDKDEQPAIQKAINLILSKELSLNIFGLIGTYLYAKFDETTLVLLDDEGHASIGNRNQDDRAAHILDGRYLLGLLLFEIEDQLKEYRENILKEGETYSEHNPTDE